MILFVDQDAVREATLVNQETKLFTDKRKYYELGTILILVRNGHDLNRLAGQRVDAQVGWDTARAGFTLDESLIGKTRTKVTIHRPVGPDKRYKMWLSDVEPRVS